MSVIVRAVQAHPVTEDDDRRIGWIDRPLIGEDVHPAGTTFGVAEGVLSVSTDNGRYVALYSAGNWVAAWIEQPEEKP